jgi:hypothetical protein
MHSLIFNGVAFDSAQGTPFIDFLGFHCILKRTVLGVKLSNESILSQNFQDPGLLESCWWESQRINGRMQAVEISNQQAFATAVALRPVAASIWLEKLRQVRSADIIKILTQMPAERMSDKIYQFIVGLLENNIKQLQSNF